MQKFNLTCDENRWKVAMVGTYSNIGRLIALSIVGYLSDRWVLHINVPIKFIGIECIFYKFI